ncbi:MAG: hypothetical protein M0P64_00275 [Candidatus Pacebacteria bacterium]|jgi:hypothetical protein|nr:hypothetical protein [Candidatus Paceibacterota bacterium]
MDNQINIFPKYACQFCGSERKLVETIIDDEFFWDEDDKIYQPNKFTEIFEHTGNQRCAQCEKEWSGL